jgi:tetratricopeptide (TPR) repeat protein
VSSAILYCAFVATGVLAFAQKAPTLPTPAPTRPPTGTTNSTTPSNTSTAPTSGTASIARPIYLSGKVVLQDGTPPPELAKIERVCGGSPHSQGYTDSKGRFQFQVDSQVGGEQDASDPNSRASGSGRPGNSAASRGQLAGCELRAVLPGFISSSLTLSNHSEFDSSEVGTIILRRAGNVDGTTISMTSLNAPKDALKAYEKARELQKKEKTEEAERSFQKAVELYPRYATAWYQLGLLQTRGHLDQAEVSFTKSIEADPKYINPYLSLALIYEQSKRWQKALELTETVIKLNPNDFPRAHFFKAAAQYNLQDTVAAEKTVRQAIDLDIRHEYPQAEKLLGMILAQRKDLTGGAEHLRRYLELMPGAEDAALVRREIANFEQQAVAVKEH